jgi:hypothetical protein
LYRYAVVYAARKPRNTKNGRTITNEPGIVEALRERGRGEVGMQKNIRSLYGVSQCNVS